MKSAGFHEIRMKSVKSGGFQVKSDVSESDADVSAKTLLILQGLGWISPEIRRIS